MRSDRTDARDKQLTVLSIDLVDGATSKPPSEPSADGTRGSGGHEPAKHSIKLLGPRRDMEDPPPILPKFVGRNEAANPRLSRITTYMSSGSQSTPLTQVLVYLAFRNSLFDLLDLELAEAFDIEHLPSRAHGDQLVPVSSRSLPTSANHGIRTPMVYSLAPFSFAMSAAPMPVDADMSACGQ
jgi:hypothetical protein